MSIASTLRKVQNLVMGEMARIQEGVDAFRRTGDPAIGAWVRGEIDLVRQRMSAPAAERREVTDQNGVKYLVDPTGATPLHLAILHLVIQLQKNRLKKLLLQIQSSRLARKVSLNG